ncbi:receptor-like protein Cf-9 [Solanum stenotomum]|uniref:receptor-like protein Cf-9 n=1 Tax=Solanum stenotomum TaxID=172797 RepID=UPI0020D03C02|nr:receptor-like protein Cf-9 [Solanum stenotomum]
MDYAIVVLLVFLCHEVFTVSSSKLPHLSHKHQTSSLLKFKNTLTVDTSASYLCQEPYPKTSSWNMSRDCCSWDGVICDEMTGHVIELDLSCNNLARTIDSNSSLFQLSHLQRLDLSLNNFSNSHISPEFGKFSSLTHLDLSDSNFSGQIPSEISHISKLQSLHLYGRLRLIAHDFKLFLQNLTQLIELDLTSINISSTIPLNFTSHLTTLRLGDTTLYGIIPETIFHLPNLETLHLWENFQLSGYFPKTKWNNNTSLQKLQLSFVNFSHNFPESIGYLTSLRYLYLQNCNLRGPIPESLLKLTRIEDLYLQYNSLNGTIPSGIFSLPSLSRLVLSNNHFSGQFEDFNSNSLNLIDLSNNQLQGHLPNSIQNLVNLTDLDISFNNFHVDVSLFSDLKQLSYLSLSYNTIDEKEVNSTLPESLEYLLLAACEVKELEFLRSAKQLSNLDLSNNNLQGRIPDWAWSNWMSLITLNISHNMLTSVDTIPLQIVYTINLRSNLLQGSLPIPQNSTTSSYPIIISVKKFLQIFAI